MHRLYRLTSKSCTDLDIIDRHQISRCVLLANVRMHRLIKRTSKSDHDYRSMTCDCRPRTCRPFRWLRNREVDLSPFSTWRLMAQSLSNSQVEKAVGAIQYLSSLNIPSDGPASGSQDGSGVSCRDSANSQSDRPTCPRSGVDGKGIKLWYDSTRSRSI